MQAFDTFSVCIFNHLFSVVFTTVWRIERSNTLKKVVSNIKFKHNLHSQVVKDKKVPFSFKYQREAIITRLLSI